MYIAFESNLNSNFVEANLMLASCVGTWSASCHHSSSYCFVCIFPRRARGSVPATPCPFTSLCVRWCTAAGHAAPSCLAPVSVHRPDYAEQTGPLHATAAVPTLAS